MNSTRRNPSSVPGTHYDKLRGIKQFLIFEAFAPDEWDADLPKPLDWDMTGHGVHWLAIA